MSAPELKTNRLFLRHWKKCDRAPFAAMNADQQVMRYFPALLSKEQSDHLAEKIEQELFQKEYGLWAVELIETKEFIGFVGLHEQTFTAPFTPCIEIGWRIAAPFWRIPKQPEKSGI